MGKSVYIVLVLCNNTIGIDSVWWNKKKAKQRKDEINNKSDSAGLVIDKWVNPNILLKAEEHTNKRITKNKILDAPLIFDERVLRLLN